MKRVLFAFIALLTFFSPNNNLRADDFDDGISKSTDDAISADDELGKAGKNIKFIIEKAKSQANVAEKGSEKGSGSGRKGSTKTGDTNENSVVMGAGSNVRGDIIIIDQGKK